MLPKMGVVVGKPKLDLPTMLKFKDDGVDGNVKGVSFLFKKTRLIPMSGLARFSAPARSR
jgi:dihydrolipoamide dehydrogenase